MAVASPARVTCWASSSGRLLCSTTSPCWRRRSSWGEPCIWTGSSPGMRITGWDELGIRRRVLIYGLRWINDSNFNPYHPLKPSQSPCFFQDSLPLSGHFSRIMGRSAKPAHDRYVGLPVNTPNTFPEPGDTRIGLILDNREVYYGLNGAHA